MILPQVKDWTRWPLEVSSSPSLWFCGMKGFKPLLHAVLEKGRLLTIVSHCCDFGQVIIAQVTLNGFFVIAGVVQQMLQAYYSYSSCRICTESVIQRMMALRIIFP